MWPQGQEWIRSRALAREDRKATRAERREAQAAYNQLRREVAEQIWYGNTVPYLPGQQGGCFRLGEGKHARFASARGVARLLGREAKEMIETWSEWNSPSSWNDVFQVLGVDETLRARNVRLVAKAARREGRRLRSADIL